MKSDDFETAVLLWADRNMPVEDVAAQASALNASGAVDGMSFSDQLNNFVPPQLWTPENTPMAAVMPDCDSHADAFVMAACAAASAPDLEVTISTDSIRHPPAEFVQTMLTLANVTKGKMTFHVGAGEIKQCKPFGHKRSQGLSRMEDLFRIFRALTEADGPISFEGRRTTLDNAYLGAARPYQPRIWGLGAGPTLVDHATSYADGLSVAVPLAWLTPEECSERIADIRKLVEQKGRDPEAFSIGAWFPVLLHDDPDVLDTSMQNPLIRWITAVFGRIEPKSWHRVGLTPPVPEDWTYFSHLLPYQTDQSFIDDVLANTTRAHVENGWTIGNPAEVAAKVKPFIEAGISWILPVDYMPIVRDPAEAMAGFQRMIEFCGALKNLS
ncbi:MAG TPA: LLM class flavin-dependent oxidoreductase [Pseudonocardia sp.]|jgi:phthiodiolone/phenolphthiodiolone dimycocerosates ketoreductase